MSTQSQDKVIPVCGLIVGPSGSGKGYCVGKIFTRFHHVKVFVTGDWCRTHLPTLAAQGVLVDDNVLNSTVDADFTAHADHYYVVDAPRSVPQAAFFLEMFRRRFPKGKVVTFHVDATHDQSFAMIKHRAIREERLDDAEPQAVEKRLRAYFGPGGIQERVVPYLRGECDAFVSIVHQGFNDPLRVSVDGIDEHTEVTRQYVRKHVAPEYFFRPQIDVDVPTESSVA
jgi:adenylate kinase family enzyme